MVTSLKIELHQGNLNQLFQFEKNGRGKPDRDLVCNYCFNIGHWKNKCPVLATKLKSSQKKSNANVSPVLMTETTKVNDLRLLMGD